MNTSFNIMYEDTSKTYGTGDRFINLRGSKGNAFSLLGLARNLAGQLQEMNPERYDPDRIISEMTSGNYANLLEVFAEYFGDYFTLYFSHEDEY